MQTSDTNADQTEAERLADQYRRQQFAQKMERGKTRLTANSGFEKVVHASGAVGFKKNRGEEDQEELANIRRELDLPTNPNASEEENKKMQLWIEKRAEIDQVADAEGKGIEPKIKEAIVGLNVMGYETTQSCEGHSGPDQFSLPWIRVAAPNEPAYRFAGQEDAFQRAATKFNTTLEAIRRADNADGYWEAMREASENGESPEHISWREQNGELIRKLQNLLDEFYQGRNVDSEVRLYIVVNPEGDFELRQGAKEYQALPEDLTDKDKQGISEKLTACQTEIDAFTKFLRQKFLGQ